jgi:hypothetical protein
VCAEAQACSFLSFSRSSNLFRWVARKTLAHVIQAPLLGRGARKLLEHGAEMRLRAESRAQGDIAERHRRCRHKVFGVENTLLQQVMVRPLTRRAAKQRGEMHR